MSNKSADVILENEKEEESIEEVQLDFSTPFNIPKSGEFTMHELTVRYYKAVVKKVNKNNHFVMHVLTR